MSWPVALGVCIDFLLDFGNPQGSLKGIISAAYSLGAILSLPFIPYVNDKFGRRGSIFGGSLVMILGAIIQGCSVNGRHYTSFVLNFSFSFSIIDYLVF